MASSWYLGQENQEPATHALHTTELVNLDTADHSTCRERVRLWEYVIQNHHHVLCSGQRLMVMYLQFHCSLHLIVHSARLCSVHSYLFIFPSTSLFISHTFFFHLSFWNILQYIMYFDVGKIFCSLVPFFLEKFMLHLYLFFFILYDT